MASHAVIALTAGDPCGIGPEVILKALAQIRVPDGVRLIIIGDRSVFEATARRLRCRLPSWQTIRADAPDGFSRPLTLLDCGHTGSGIPGRSSRAAGVASLAYLDRAIALWRACRIHALVTAPVTKWAIARSEPTFVGQTEYFARAMGARDVVMMFVSDRLRIALLTRHLPLHRVPGALTKANLRRTLRLTARGLTRWFGIRHPRLALCGLNPHAGEAGGFGQEEQAVMIPVLRALRRDGVACDGPFAADGFFARLHEAGRDRRRRRGRTRLSSGGPTDYDAVVCPYHDQGLIPFKLVARDRGCQMSLGLPLIRTSPDHGSGLDIAGRALADPGSMVYAMTLAIRFAGGRRASPHHPH
ncbi:MAG: 4-hydroxythreonine-4-phosphate dehydrogenase PdxA [Candidatus Omnitrophica bacterium]|nr:4-hydroxythreonine-4-phosphate dehydrogenase PdxA [Candidatus Omnitrophota bacterium]